MVTRSERDECPHGMVPDYCAACRPAPVPKPEPPGDASRAVRFVDDDAGFDRWQAENPWGWILNCDRVPKKEYLILHRVSGCAHLEGDGLTWTTSYIKVCAPNRSDLDAWARQEVGGAPRVCGSCDR